MCEVICNILSKNIGELENGIRSGCLRLCLGVMFKGDFYGCKRTVLVRVVCEFK